MSEDEADSTLVTAFSFCMYKYGSMRTCSFGSLVATMRRIQPFTFWQADIPRLHATFVLFSSELLPQDKLCVVTCGSIWITFQSNFEKCFDSLPSLSVRLHPTFLIPHGLENLHSSGRAEDLKERCALDPLSCDLKGKALCYFNK